MKINLPKAPTHEITPSLPNAPKGMITTKEELEDIQKALKHLKMINDLLIKYVDGWRRQTDICPNYNIKDICKNKNSQKCLEEIKKPKDKELKPLCDNPIDYIKKTNESLENWLNKTYDYKNGKMAISQSEYYQHMIRGLNILYNYIIVLPYFIREGDFFTNDKNKNLILKRSIIKLIEELVGCTSNFTYRYLNSLSKIPQFQEMTKINSQKYSYDMVRKYNMLLNICEKLQSLVN